MSENIPKAKAKKVTPQRRKSNDEKEIYKSDEEVVKVKKLQGEAKPTIHVPYPFPQLLHKDKESNKLGKIMTKHSKLLINIPLLEEIQEIPGYAKLMKKLMSKKKLIEGDTIEVTHRSSAIIDSKVMKKKNDLGAFTIPWTIRTHEFAKALYDLGANINLMPYVIYKKHGLDTPTPTLM
ncbi:uncharacterized protein LOC107874247 [Capsicum annuum]|uniref:uncharacterized protein LOC107874247 n=1 Tax=Capsicum annuum TaxID=4072 RepID=UPI0007BF6E90|nr:uncharacterized protein LOC107874247 [Capsicum annuum]